MASTSKENANGSVGERVVVRDLAARDRAQWLLLWQGYLDFYASNLDAGITDLTFARMIDPSEPMFGLVAERDGRLVGLAHSVLHRATWTRTHYCYLEDLFTVPEERGKGVGRGLIEATYAKADALGCTRVYWLTNETNETARKLYDKVAQRSGFIHYRR